MTTSNDDLMKRLEDLRHEMDSINLSIASLRSDEMTKAFREQIGASFLENNRNAFRSAMEGCDLGAMPFPRETLDELSNLYDDAIARYEKDDMGGAMSILEELISVIDRTLGSEQGAGSAPRLLGAVNNTMQQMALMETLRSKVGRPMLRRSCESVFGGLEPEKVESYLSPLASAVRIKILAMLYTSARSFTEMSRELDMKKGHLQFHLKRLSEANYIKVDPRTHLYSIEGSAFLIMDGLGKLLANIDR